MKSRKPECKSCRAENGKRPKARRRAADAGLAHPILRLQSKVGNRAVLAMLPEARSTPDAQAGEKPGRAPGSCKCGGTCPECRARNARRHELGQSALRGTGRTLPGVVRADMESRFDHDFGDVRIHDHPRAHRAARALGARAYTVGPNVAFARGEYRPETRRGRGVLAHELAHVVQQSGRAGRAAALTVGPVTGPAEREAERARRAVEDDRAVGSVRHSSTGVLQRKPGSAAGGCGVCYQCPPCQDVGIAAHALIETAMVAQWAFLVPRFQILNILPSLGAGGIPDLMEFTGPDSVAIGEVKPNSPSGISRGRRELREYEAQLGALGMQVTRMNWPPPWAPLPFPTRAEPSATCPATHDLYVDAPDDGLYTYWCNPDFKELRPRCSCKKKEEEEDKVKDPVPVADRVKQTEGAEEDAREEEKEPSLDPKDVLVPIGVAAAIGVGLTARKRLASGALAKKAAGRAFVYAEALAAIALVTFYSDRLQAAPAGSDELAMEALLRALRAEGAQVPPDLAKRIQADPELKTIVEEAAKSGNFDEAQAKVQAKIAKLINDHPDEFTDEDLRILMMATSASGTKAGTAKDPSVEGLKKAIERARSGKASRGAEQGKEDGGEGGADGGGTEKGEAGGEEGGERGGGKGVHTGLPPTKPPKDVPKTKYPALSAEVQAQLDAAPAPIRFVLQQMLGRTKGGPKLSDTAVQRYLATVPPNLTEEEAARLTKLLVSAEGKTLDQILLSLSHAVGAIRKPPSEEKPDPSKVEDAPEAAERDKKPAKAKARKPDGPPEKPPKRDQKPSTGKRRAKRPSEKTPHRTSDESRRKLIQILRLWKGWDAITPSGNRYVPAKEGASFENVGTSFMVLFFQQSAAGVRSVGAFIGKVESYDEGSRQVVMLITDGASVLADDGTDLGREVGAFVTGNKRTITLIEEGSAK